MSENRQKLVDKVLKNNEKLEAAMKYKLQLSSPLPRPHISMKRHIKSVLIDLQGIISQT